MNRFSLIAIFLFGSSMSPAFATDWRPLFDGLSFQGWTDQDGQAVASSGWEVADGMLHLDRSQGKGGNLLTHREYGNLELTFEWKVAEGSNNGIKYRVRDFDGRTLGIEYQVIDDFNHSTLSANHKTASIYDVYDAKPHAVLNPAGEFNRGRIVVRGNHIQHWLNGHLITEACVGSAAWQSRIAKSKFANVEGFGSNHYGRIMITDHHDEVWYRNVFIRELPTCPTSQFVRSTQRTHYLRPCVTRQRRGLRGWFRRR